MESEKDRGSNFGGGGEVEEDGEDEEEMEEVILMVEVPGLPADSFNDMGYCSILGLDTSEPVLQIGNNVYKGKFEDTFGSSLLFADEGDGLEYLCKSEKKLVMEKIMLRDKMTTEPLYMGNTGTVAGEAMVTPPAGQVDDTLPTPTSEPGASGISSTGNASTGELVSTTISSPEPKSSTQPENTIKKT